MLTWNEEINHLGNCWKGEQNIGLTELGKQAVNKMQSLGMVVDTSHLIRGFKHDEIAKISYGNFDRGIKAILKYKANKK